MEADKNQGITNEITTWPNGVERIPYVFQPIFDTTTKDDRIIGYEALMRPKNMTPVNYIEEVLNKNDGHKLEFLTFYNAIKQYDERGLTGSLFINSFPYEVLAKAEFDEIQSIIPERLKGNIIVEDLEYGDKMSLLLLSNKISCLKEYGYKIALDDFGMGINSIEMLKFIKPEIVKIDRYYVAGCTKNAVARNTIEIVIESIKSNGGEILVEGVETKAEYDFLKSHNDVKYMQGFYLAMPE